MKAENPRSAGLRLYVSLAIEGRHELVSCGRREKGVCGNIGLRYRHRHGSTGHGADHLLPVFVSPSITIPVIDGRMALGTWQSLVLVDLNRDNPRRRVRLSFVTG